MTHNYEHDYGDGKLSDESKARIKGLCASVCKLMRKEGFDVDEKVSTAVSLLCQVIADAPREERKTITEFTMSAMIQSLVDGGVL